MIFGAELESINQDRCEAILDWVLNGSSSSWLQSDKAQWLLAHCDDGVVWGFQNSQELWQLSSNVSFPSVKQPVSPALQEETLQQLRLFGEEGELLVWRGDAGLQGRWLQDNDSRSLTDYLKPKDEHYLLLGNRLLDDPVGGFSLVGDATGSRHAVPVECSQEDLDLGRGAARQGAPWALQLEVRHYLEQNESTGVVRIAASRLVRVLNRRQED